MSEIPGERKRLVIMGAAGRDFHNFLTCFRDDSSVEVVAFTAAQIPGIANRLYPSELAGPLYPNGIPIVPEESLDGLLKEARVHQVVFAYSDVSHLEVMHKASKVLAAGADFMLLGPDRTMLRPKVPCISVCAVRTGCGKSGVIERIWETLDGEGIHSVVLRHPMPYSDLSRKRVERYQTFQDLDKVDLTLEEREEYEHLVRKGIVVYAGVDYSEILREAEEEAQIILWDGGNNDFPFVRPDLEITVLDPHRPGHETSYHPGEVNLLRAHVLIMNKVDTAPPGAVEKVLASIKKMNPRARLIQTSSRILVDDPEIIRGKEVLVVEDGPTLTHGQMAYGAGVLAARRHGARALADPRPHAQGSLRETFSAYPHLERVLPAQGYSPEQLKDLEATIEATPCDVVVVATPIDLSRLIRISRPVVRVTYKVEEIGFPTLDSVIKEFLQEKALL